jgi:predicted permease
MLNIIGDAVYALRQFRRSPVFTLTAVLTLSLGIGGTTAIFSLMHTVMLSSLPVTDPGALYRVGSGFDCCVEGGPQNNWGMYSYPLFERLRAAAPEFEEMAAFQSTDWSYSVLRPNLDRIAKPLRGELVTGNYFSVFGIRPFAGRLFSKADDQASAAPVAVLSYRSWQRDWGGGAMIGSSVIIQGQPFTVIGVAPPGFFGDTLRSNPPDFWLPLQQEPLVTGRDSLLRQSTAAWLRAIGRLKRGSTTEGMAPRLTAALRQWIARDSGYSPAWMSDLQTLLPKQNIEVVPAANGVEEMRDDYGRSLQILLAVCGLVLLITCANVANLLIARGMARRVQTSIRMAMGASRARLISQSLVESVLLALAGGIAGIAIAYGADKILVALAFTHSSYLPFDTKPSTAAFLFAVALSLLTSVLFGAVPAWLAARRDPVEALRGANRSTRDHSSVSRKALLVLQATLSVVLVTGSALLTRSLGKLERQDFGFQTNGLILVTFDRLPATYSQDRLDAIYRDLQERLERLPGVRGASLELYAPFTDNWGELIYVDGHPPARFSTNAGASWDRVSAGHFETLGQPVVRGRGFTRADSSRTENVAVVNESFVRRFFGNEDPLDKHFGIDLSVARTYRIVGVVRDAKYFQPARPVRPMFFVPLAQRVAYQQENLQQLESRSHFITGALLRTNARTGDLEPLLRKTIAAADANLTPQSIRTMREQISFLFDQERAVASLASLFGLVAVVLASVGLYGVTAYTVIQRTREIGVRMALGANKGGVLGLVLKGAFAMIGLGLGLGIPLAVAAGHLISAQLYEIAWWDPVAVSVAVIALAASAFVAALIPAWRAASIDPMTALRME